MTFTFPHTDNQFARTGASIESCVNDLMHEIHLADREAGEAWKWRYTAIIQERVWCYMADRISREPGRWSELVKDGDRMVVRRWTPGGEVTIIGDFYETEPLDEWAIRLTREPSGPKVYRQDQPTEIVMRTAGDRGA